MADVFISYKSERRAAAEHLAEILADYGYSVWWDYGLISGRDFGAQIEKELRAARTVVVLWCSMAAESEWVREEAALAKRLEKVIPTFIEKVDLPLGFSLSQTLDLSDWDGAPKSARLDRLLRDIGQFVGRAPKPNMEGLERTERAWRRFGGPPLREFALIDALERKLPPRTLPGALFSQDGGEKNKSRQAAGGPNRVLLIGGALALALAAAVAAWTLIPREQAATAESGEAAAQAASVEGRWVGEGQDCAYAMRLVIEGEALTIVAPGYDPSTEAITERGEGISTATGTYFRRGEALVLRALDGSETVFQSCPP